MGYKHNVKRKKPDQGINCVKEKDIRINIRKEAMTRF